MAKIVGGIVIVLLIVLGLWWWMGKDDADTVSTTEKNQGTMSEEKESALADKGVIASIKDAMKSGVAMQCSYTGGTGSEAYQSDMVVKGEMFKTTTVMGDMTVYGIFDGETQYTWTSKDKQGMKMGKECLDGYKDAATSNDTTVSQPKDLRESFDMAMNVSCQPVVGTADFTVPSDITFTDQCAMMKQAEEMMKQFQNQLPQGVTLPAVPSGQ